MTRPLPTFHLAFVAAMLALVWAAAGSDYEVSSECSAGGGGSASSEMYSLSDTIAQPAVGAGEALAVGIDYGWWPTIGSPPVLRQHSVKVLAAYKTQIPFSELLAGLLDEDQDSARVVSVLRITPKGGHVELQEGDLVVYTSPPNYYGQDSFTFTVADDGGDSSTASVLVQVVSPADVAPQLAYGPEFLNGELIVRYSGVPGWVYTIEVSDALAPAGWRKYSTVYAPLSGGLFGPGVFEVRTPVGYGPSRFLRLVYPAY